MRSLSAVVNDVARAMRRTGAKFRDREQFGERVAGQCLINYADLLKAATKRQTTKNKPLARVHLSDGE